MESKQTVHIAYWKFLYPTQHKHNIKQNKTKQLFTSGKTIEHYT